VKKQERLKGTKRGIKVRGTFGRPFLLSLDSTPCILPVIAISHCPDPCQFNSTVPCYFTPLLNMAEPVENKPTTPTSIEGFKGSNLPPSVTEEPPHVLIAGGGLGGLFLGILLEKAGIPYTIFERATEMKPLGE
jgi:hypothetical protein